MPNMHDIIILNTRSKNVFYRRTLINKKVVIGESSQKKVVIPKKIEAKNLPNLPFLITFVYAY